MKTIGVLIRRELRSYFDTAWGWTILALVLVIDGLMFNAFALGTKERLSDSWQHLTPSLLLQMRQEIVQEKGQ